MLAPLTRLLAVAVVLFATHARADGEPDVTQTLEEARDLMAHKRYAEACPKLEEAVRSAPSSGVALYNLAKCYEDNGQTASAHTTFARVAERAVAANISQFEAIALERMRDLELRLATLTIRLEHARPGVTITRNGQLVPPTSWAIAAPMDPGTYRIEARDPRHTPWVREVVVPNKQAAVDVLVPDFDAVPVRHSPLRAIGLTGTFLGAGSLIAGSIFGVAASTQHAGVEKTCPNGGCPFNSFNSDELTHENNVSRSFALASTITFIAGGVLAVVGVTLALISPGKTVRVGARALEIAW